MLNNRIKHKLIEKTNPYLGGIRRWHDGIDSNFTIISNNCWAGSVYRWFNLPYLTPTAGLYFYANDYNRFLSNLKYYCSLELEEVSLKFSKHRNTQIKRKQEHVPIGRLDDVEIIFLHYPTFQEAKEKWERRCSRICWDHLIVKNAEMNECNSENIIEFDKLPFDNKFIFTAKDYGISSQVIFKEYVSDGYVKDDTTLFNKYINLANLIKGLPFKVNQ